MGKKTWGQLPPKWRWCIKCKRDHRVGTGIYKKHKEFLAGPVVKLKKQ